MHDMSVREQLCYSLCTQWPVHTLGDPCRLREMVSSLNSLLPKSLPSENAFFLSAREGTRQLLTSSVPGISGLNS